MGVLTLVLRGPSLGESRAAYQMPVCPLPVWHHSTGAADKLSSASVSGRAAMSEPAGICWLVVTARTLLMAPTMPRPHVDEAHEAQSPAGLRFSRSDGLVLLIAGTVTLAAWNLRTNPGALVLTVVGHFFLFCNVVRLRRAFELLWAGCYVVVTSVTVAGAAFNWGLPLIAITPVTLVLVVLEGRSERYHGVGWRILNPTWGLRRRRTLTDVVD
jgi:hypothetical protein